jgi:hypothetical protein
MEDTEGTILPQRHRATELEFINSFPKLCELCVSVVISVPSVFSLLPSAPSCDRGQLISLLRIRLRDQKPRISA